MPSQGDLPGLGTQPGSPASQTDSLQSEPTGKPDIKYMKHKKQK